MKFTKIILSAIAVFTLAAAPAIAGQYGIDAYAGARTVLPSLTPVTISVAAAPDKTNGPIDKLNWIGDASVMAFAWTNAAVNGVTLAINTSTDSTNWTPMANASIATAATVNITNSSFAYNGSYYFGTFAGLSTNGNNINWGTTNCPVATDYLLYPFVVTTPTAAISLQATPYPAENPFTNTSPFTLSGNGGYEIGFHCIDQPRYLQFVWHASGAGATNVTAFSFIKTPLQ